MVDDVIRQMSKKTWYKWSLYINIVLFFIVAIMLYYLMTHCINYGENGGEIWRYITLDIGIIAIAMSLIFFQFIRNLFIIMRRSL